MKPLTLAEVNASLDPDVTDRFARPYESADSAFFGGVISALGRRRNGDLDRFDRAAKLIYGDADSFYANEGAGSVGRAIERANRVLALADTFDHDAQEDK